MNILHVSAECYPLAKVGGLADVVGALPKFQQKENSRVSVCLPCYDTPVIRDHTKEKIFEGTVSLGMLKVRFEVVTLPDFTDFEVFLVVLPGMFDREEVYAYPDDVERFTTFQIAVVKWLLDHSHRPDIIHCHDHHTGLIPFFITRSHAFTSLSDIPTVLTIHNAQYQGNFGYDKLYYIPDFDPAHTGLLDWSGQINPLATGIKCAWKVTTVSPSYMEELRYAANGLEGLLQHEKNKTQGILNGIDTDVWNPATDTMLISNYSLQTLKKGKHKNKKYLCEEFGLDEDLPLFIFIGRLVYEKGADLLPDIISETFKKFKASVNLLILGSGNEEIASRLEAHTSSFPGYYNTYVGYNERLSRIMYAGADFLLMPSRVEPCGLNQMYALRYGTIPIVRRTGGLRDTIIDVGDPGGFGICHDQASVEDVCYSIARAVTLYNHKKQFEELRRRIMKINHSWEQTARHYQNLYNSLKIHSHEE
ncbi:glycogen synthase [Ascidiimonas aurantiaca]|uniref:glycogen synthase n=1 Tax=Ascidiimonas aurantiaca TaxID=1685432 RepID=UPI0030EDE457